MSEDKKDLEYLSVNKDSFDVNKIKESLDIIRNEVDLSNLDFSNDKLAFYTQRIMLNALLSTIPVAIEAYMNKPTQGQAYSLTNLYAQVLELFSEIRGSQSLEDQVLYISEQIIDPLLKGITSELFDAVFYTKQSMKQEFEQEYLDKIFTSYDNLLKSFAVSVNKRKEVAEEKLKEYLLEVK